jgi:hypothetical protein
MILTVEYALRFWSSADDKEHEMRVLPPTHFPVNPGLENSSGF